MTIEQWLGTDNQLGIDIWNKKYRLNSETFDEWVDRVSGGDEDVKALILAKQFLFGGRILAMRGVNDGTKASFSNCYVITPPSDNLESIYDTCKSLARTYSYGGGCGIDISHLAPAGAMVHNQAKTSSGAVSFMDTFSQVTQQIGQHGRRGALMISLDCHHPDLIKFITIKNDLSKVNFANISVRITSDFMQAVVDDKPWTLSFTREETGEVIETQVSAKAVYHILCESNWNYAEPGILFWDRIESYNLQSENPNFHYAGTNPCGEEPLPAGGACLLGALNLSEFVENGKFDFPTFEDAVIIAVKALNEVQHEGENRHPLAEQRESAKEWRQIGLGVMGIADMLIKCHLAYGSAESLALCDNIGKTMAQKAIEGSCICAQVYGTYDKWSDSIFDSTYYLNHVEKDSEEDMKYRELGLANSQLLTIAPTGTLSTMLGISGGIEPIFANYYTRTTKTLHDGQDVTYKVYTPIVAQYMQEHSLTTDDELPSYFVTAADIPIANRIAMQATWQSHIDASISSTINLPNEATVEDIENLYIGAWQAGLKGVTVYRAGCAREGILNAEPKEQKEEIKQETKEVEIKYVAKKNIGLERHLTTGCGSLHICAFFDEHGNLKNTYLSKGSTGGCNNFMIGLSRMISLAARNGTPIEDIVDQLKSSGACPSYAVRTATKHDTSSGSCCPVAIGIALKEMWKEVNGKEFEEKKSEIGAKAASPSTMSHCPECGGELKHEMGCVTCTQCGYSKCG